MKADWQPVSHASSSTTKPLCRFVPDLPECEVCAVAVGGRAECWGPSGRQPGPQCVDDFTSHILCCADCFNLPWRGEEPEFLLLLNYHTHMLTHMCMCLYTHTHRHGFLSPAESHAYVDLLLVFMIAGCRKEFSLPESESNNCRAPKGRVYQPVAHCAADASYCIWMWHFVSLPHSAGLSQ